MILYKIFHKSSLENQPYYNLKSIFRAFKRKEMKASRRLAENDIITSGITVKDDKRTNLRKIAVCFNNLTKCTKTTYFN
jgi:hypothetical protein